MNECRCYVLACRYRCAWRGSDGSNKQTLSRSIPAISSRKPAEVEEFVVLELEARQL